MSHTYIVHPPSLQFCLWNKFVCLICALDISREKDLFLVLAFSNAPQDWFLRDPQNCQDFIQILAEIVPLVRLWELSLNERDALIWKGFIQISRERWRILTFRIARIQHLTDLDKGTRVRSTQQIKREDVYITNTFSSFIDL